MLHSPIAAGSHRAPAQPLGAKSACCSFLCSPRGQHRLSRDGHGSLLRAQPREEVAGWELAPESRRWRKDGLQAALPQHSTMGLG